MNQPESIEYIGSEQGIPSKNKMLTVFAKTRCQLKIEKNPRFGGQDFFVSIRNKNFLNGWTVPDHLIFGNHSFFLNLSLSVNLNLTRSFLKLIHIHLVNGRMCRKNVFKNCSQTFEWREGKVVSAINYFF